MARCEFIWFQALSAAFSMTPGVRSAHACRNSLVQCSTVACAFELQDTHAAIAHAMESAHALQCPLTKMVSCLCFLAVSVLCASSAARGSTL